MPSLDLKTVRNIIDSETEYPTPLSHARKVHWINMWNQYGPQFLHEMMRNAVRETKRSIRLRVEQAAKGEQSNP